MGTSEPDWPGVSTTEDTLLLLCGPSGRRALCFPRRCWGWGGCWAWPSSASSRSALNNRSRGGPVGHGASIARELVCHDRRGSGVATGGELLGREWAGRVGLKAPAVPGSGSISLGCWLRLPLLHRSSCLAAFSSLGLPLRSTTPRPSRRPRSRGTAPSSRSSSPSSSASSPLPKLDSDGSCRPARLPSASCLALAPHARMRLALA